jgi:hypothetical protein
VAILPRPKAIIFPFSQRASSSPAAPTPYVMRKHSKVRAGKEKLVATITGTLMAPFGRDGIAH